MNRPLGYEDDSNIRCSNAYITSNIYSRFKDNVDLRLFFISLTIFQYQTLRANNSGEIKKDTNVGVHTNSKEN